MVSVDQRCNESRPNSSDRRAKVGNAANSLMSHYVSFRKKTRLNSTSWDELSRAEFVAMNKALQLHSTLTTDWRIMSLS